MALKGVAYADRITPATSTTPEIDGWARIQSLEPQWWYNWNQKRIDGTGSNFVPMLYSGSQSRLDALAADLDSCNMPTRVLGFNEPDHPQQTHMDVSDALALWPKLEAAAAVEKLKIGSPATISPGAAWLDDFMTQAVAQGLKVDFIACHIYQNPHVGTFMSKVDALRDKWGLPVWVTETAVADFSATVGSGVKSAKYTRDEVNAYMQDLFAEAAKRPWLERIAWKTRANSDEQMWFSSLFNSNGTLTSTGVTYRNLTR